jgi:cell division protein FtsB
VRPLFRPILVAVLLVAAAAAWAWLDAEDGVDTWRRLHVEVAEAEARAAGLEARNEALRAEIDALAGDPFVQERAIREELRWARPGEVVVRVPRHDAPLTVRGAQSAPTAPAGAPAAPPTLDPPAARAPLP